MKHMKVQLYHTQKKIYFQTTTIYHNCMIFFITLHNVKLMHDTAHLAIIF